MTHGSGKHNKIWRESSYKFWSRDDKRAPLVSSASRDDDGDDFDFRHQGDTEEVEEDPPTRLIGQFLHRQQASGDFSLDIDLEMQELREETKPSILPPVIEESPSPLKERPSKASKVSFDEELRNGNGEGEDDRVVKFTSNASFRSNDSFKRKSRASTPKSNKSRLLDPPQLEQPQSDARSTKSGMLTRWLDENDEDDSFSGEDLPEEYKKAKIDLLVGLEWVSLILLVGALVCSLVIPYLKRKTLWKLKLWKWEVMVLVLICGRLVSSWGIRVIIFFIERNFLLRKRVLYFVYGLRKAVQNCLWLGQVLVAWHFLFNKKVEREGLSHRVCRYIEKLRHIFVEDLMRFMVEDEAMRTISLFEGASENHGISKSSLKNWVVNAFRARIALALSLDDTKTAVNKLQHMVNTLVGILIVIVWLQILGIATKKILLLVTSQLLLVVFIFGSSCKNTFESIIFLFVMHPFDVGDRCEVDRVEMVVEEMNILTTVFLRSDNLKIVIPNSVLATKTMNNYYHSPDMGDVVEFSVHIYVPAVPAEKIAIMKQRITSYIEGKKGHWHPKRMIIIKDVEDLTRLRIAVCLRHRMNHQDMGEKWARRALLVEEMVEIFRELDIQYRLLPLDAYHTFKLDCTIWLRR